MKLTKSELETNYKSDLDNIRAKSSEIASVIEEQGCTEEVLAFLSECENLEYSYLELVKNSADIGYFKLLQSATGEQEEFIIAAAEKKVPYDQLNEWINTMESFEIDEKINSYESEESLEEEQPEEEKTEDINISESQEEFKQEPTAEDKTKTDKEEIPPAPKVIQESKPEKTKADFILIMEDLLGEPIDNLINLELPDSSLEVLIKNLEMLVTNVTESISIDKKKTSTINNLKRIVKISARKIERSEEQINEMKEKEAEYKARIKILTEEREDYKQKYEALDKKVKAIQGEDNE